jgi:isochorismate pyruvate lyase
MKAVRCRSLAEIRERIDALDRAIVAALAERGEYVIQAAAFKRDDAAVRAAQRAALVVENARRIALEEGADPDVVGRIYREIVAAFTDAELATHRRK